MEVRYCIGTARPDACSQDLQSRKLSGKKLTKYLTDDVYDDACLHGSATHDQQSAS